MKFKLKIKINVDAPADAARKRNNAYNIGLNSYCVSGCTHDTCETELR